MKIFLHDYNLALEKLRESYINDIAKIDTRIELLKIRIEDELAGKSIIDSDTEFDDPSVDPRYEFQRYENNNTKLEDSKIPIPQRPKSNTGLYKGNDMRIANTFVSARNEKMQIMRAEKQIKQQHDRVKTLRSIEDTKSAVSTLSTSLQEKREKLKIAEQRQMEEDSNEPIRYGFDLIDIPSDYKLQIPSEKYHGNGYIKEQDVAYDNYSHQYIATRYIPEDILNNQIGDTNVYRLSTLLREASVRKDYFNQTNFILVGIVAEKFDTTIDRFNAKSIKIRLTDFVYDIMVTLTGEAQEKYWKVQPGTLIAILNPEMQDRYYKKKGVFVHNSNDFILKVKNDSGIIEYARARDFAICSSDRCKHAVDIMKSRFCPYHKEKNADKAASNRMEMGSGYKSYAPVDSNGNRQAMVMTFKQVEELENVNTFKGNKTSGLAIENAAPNPPLKEIIGGGVLLTDYSDPLTISNMQSKAEKNAIKGVSKDTISEFLGTGIRYDRKHDKNAIIKQEKNRELDNKLKKKQRENDFELQSTYKKALQAVELKKLKAKQGLELVKELSIASKTEKTLKKDRDTISALKREREEASEHLRDYRIKKHNTTSLGDNDIDIHQTGIVGNNGVTINNKNIGDLISKTAKWRHMNNQNNERGVDLSSDSESDY